MAFVVLLLVLNITLIWYRMSSHSGALKARWASVNDGPESGCIVHAQTATVLMI